MSTEKQPVHRNRRAWYPYLALAACVQLGACADDGPRQAIRQRAMSLAAQCAVDVVGFGVKDVESDYLPNVVNCENGDADTEQLKAQAVAARTYLYYKLEQSGGTIGSSTSTQVYSCARASYLDQKHYDAVKATAGQVLMHGGLVIWACYNAGTEQTPPDCEPTGTGADTCVTYNEGKTGSDVTPSPCGHPDNPKNRGCMSQNGGHCLSLDGRTYDEILRYYYGADIDIVTATGACITPPPDAGPPPPADQGSDRDPPPGSDGGVDAASVLADATTTTTEDALPPSTGEPGPLADDGSAAGQGLHGSCRLGAPGQAAPSWPWLLLLAALVRRRRTS